MRISMANILMELKGLYQDGNYIITMMIAYLGWSMVHEFTHKRIECKKNTFLFQFLDWLTIETVHDITEILKDKTILLTSILWYLYDRSTMNIP